MFGENFTTTGLFENDLHIGDRFQIGSAVIVIRQPRVPCYKLAAKFQRRRHSEAIPGQRAKRFLLFGGAGGPIDE